MEPVLLTRDAFREAVFARDGYKCVFCGAPAKDAHHIIERRLWPDGGYYLENGASVCEDHHLACERTIWSVEDVRHHAGITKVVVPPHLYDDHVYDKWGNPVLEDGRRAKGELFYDESVQKALREGGVLDRFTPYVKYPRTHHLPWSPGIHDDDRVLADLSAFEGRTVVVTEKLDGENTTCYADGHVHARSIDSRGGEDRAWVKKFLIENVCFNLPNDWRLCGENVWAKHSIHYDDLLSYFYGFSLWDERNNCLSWNDTITYFAVLSVMIPEVLWQGVWNESRIRAIGNELDTELCEGYVVRVVDGFSYGQFKTHVAKWVRPGHVQTTKHWRAGQRFTPNRLAE
jgi:hypothetical protein